MSFVTKCNFNWEESWRKMISGASGYFVRMVLERCAKEGGGLQDVDAAVLRVSCCCFSWFQVTQLLLRFPSEHVPFRGTIRAHVRFVREVCDRFLATAER